jgi:hypothetical protein
MTFRPGIKNAINALVPAAACGVRGGNETPPYDIDWEDARPRPSDTEIETKHQELLAAYSAEVQKSADYDADVDRTTFWDNVDSMTKDEFKQFVSDYVTDQATAKQAIIRLAMEVARLRRA